MKLITKALLASSVFALAFAVGVTSPTFVGGDTAVAGMTDDPHDNGGNGSGSGDEGGGGGGGSGDSSGGHGGGGGSGHDGHGGGGGGGGGRDGDRGGGGGANP